MLWGHLKNAQKPGDTDRIWEEPTTSVSISVQRKPSVWTGGGRLCPEDGVCCSSDTKLWKETEAYFSSFGLRCVISFHVSSLLSHTQHLLLLSLLRLLCLVTSTLHMSHTFLQNFYQFRNFPYLADGILNLRLKVKIKTNDFPLTKTHRGPLVIIWH